MHCDALQCIGLYCTMRCSVTCNEGQRIAHRAGDACVLVALLQNVMGPSNYNLFPTVCPWGKYLHSNYFRYCGYLEHVKYVNILYRDDLVSDSKTAWFAHIIPSHAH